MTHTIIDEHEVEALGGAFRKMRVALDVQAFGINRFDFPPGGGTPEHDEVEVDHEEVYIILAGSGTLTVEGEDVELRPGRWVRIDAVDKRNVTAGPEGLSMIAIGATTGKGTHRPNM